MGNHRRVPSQAQLTFVKEYVANDHVGVQAALAAYDTTSYPAANSIASENLQKPSIRALIDKALAKHNLTPDRWSETISDAMNANTVQVLGDGKSIENPDHAIRLKAVDMCARLADAYPHTDASRHEHRHLHLQVSEDPAILRFKVIHGRAPTDREIADMQVHNAIDIQAETDKSNDRK